MKYFFNLSAVMGVLLVFGTAGASDTAHISISQIAVQIGISIGLVFLGYYGRLFLQLNKKVLTKPKHKPKSQLSRAA